MLYQIKRRASYPKDIEYIDLIIIRDNMTSECVVVYTLLDTDKMLVRCLEMSISGLEYHDWDGSNEVSCSNITSSST